VATIGDRNLERVKTYINSMPSLPTTVSKVLEICNNPRTSPMDLNRVISLDPVLMGRVLKLINSAYYGLGQQITSLVRAIIMLGINTVKNLALSTAVIDKLGKNMEFRALNMEGFWRHSLAAASCARLIARRRGVDQLKLEEYFAAGLLHDLGKIPLNNVMAQEYLGAMAVADREKISLILAEKRVLDIDHAEVGGMIAEAWKLDRSIAEALQYHHSPELYQGPNAELLYTVIVADYYANREEIGFSGNRYPEKPSPAIYQSLALSKEVLEEITEEVNAEIEKAKVFLKLA
jgi:putative nucleotidyltransferase with HDIG domain